MIFGPTRDDRGSASAEFAVALPAAVLVVALGIGALAAAGTQVRLQDAASNAARLIARGEPERAPGVVHAAVSGAHAAIGRDGDLVCVTATHRVSIGVFSLPLSATGCALESGI
ncbi:TadE family type IV pilus minor pilin [Microbacterium amylolyticum]|uniref:TadE-like protein n=1 Tax=Microbacterium amylolyticum TaxID=936337 RepID=A0ABS4ZJM6_9MICO|nr:TadE family type IV pilus minor pilin [Microbacterium amylolyticum]MBP2437481.1 hypothetical protein [Microbacterium amylolyticum]